MPNSAGHFADFLKQGCQLTGTREAGEKEGPTRASTRWAEPGSYLGLLPPAAKLEGRQWGVGEGAEGGERLC